MSRPNKAAALRAPLGPASSQTNIIDAGQDLSEMMTEKLHIGSTHPSTENEKIDWEKERKDMDKLFEQQAEIQLKDLPAFMKPKQFKKTTRVYDHQKDGARWLIAQERNPRLNPFSHQRQLKDGSIGIYDRFSRGRLAENHPPVKGSILADEMGLGKTLQTIALIVSNPPSGHVYGNGNKNDSADSPICTLIVCPVSVISNWKTQIEDFVKADTFRVETFIGDRKKRSKIIERVAAGKVDILLSSYETISSEFEKEATDSKGNVLRGIHDTAFWRIVIDEGQTIRNSKSKAFKSVMAVADKSQNRLALTGTPFVNKPSDIHSLLAFVGLSPLADPSVFKVQITDPIQQRKRAGLTRLRLALAYVALRRTKNIVNLEMVEKTVNITRVDFTEGAHKNIHDCLYFAARLAFEGSINGKGRVTSDSEAGITGNAQQALFETLLRVRQACCSGTLVPADRYSRALTVMKNMKLEDGTMKEISAKEGNKIIDFLQSGTADGENVDLALGSVNKEPSPKVAALLGAIGEMKLDEKAVIFSQWTTHLDYIERFLVKAGHKFVRIDGTMSQDDRSNAIYKLNNDDQTRLMLVSLKSGGVGINLTRASVVFMMDPWWNYSVEVQAIDRVHRMGQTRPVRVYRMVMAGTVEERMLTIQHAKAALGEGSFKKLSPAEEKAAKITALKDLFQIDELGGDNFGDDEAGGWLY